MLNRLRTYVNTASYKAPQVGDSADQAAVLLALTESVDNPSIILTKRSENLSSHRGEVSLPGGKWESQDSSLVETALRETQEEIGLDPSQVELLGPLAVFQTYRSVNVVPFVGIVPEGLIYRPNPGELDAVFQVPVSFFLEDNRIRTDVFDRDVGHTWSPAYNYQGFEIWGFTARVLVNFLSKALDVDIGPDNPAPVRNWTR